MNRIDFLKLNLRQLFVTLCSLEFNMYSIIYYYDLLILFDNIVFSFLLIKLFFNSLYNILLISLKIDFEWFPDK